MNKADATAVAETLRKLRPRDYLTNEQARRQWYATVSAFAEMLRDEIPRWTGDEATKFFDQCGVPS